MSAEDEKIIRRVLEALSDAREAVNWPPMRLRPTTRLRLSDHGGLAKRLEELREDGDGDPEAILIAVVRAKVADHRSRDGKHGEGHYAVAATICAAQWWPANLAAGRALLAGAKAHRTRGGGYVPHSEEYDLR